VRRSPRAAWVPRSLVLASACVAGALAPEALTAKELLRSGDAAIWVERVYRHHPGRVTTSPANRGATHPVRVDVFCDPDPDALLPPWIPSDPLTRAACAGTARLDGLTVVDLAGSVRWITGNQVAAFVQSTARAQQENTRRIEQARQSTIRAKHAAERRDAVAAIRQRIAARDYPAAFGRIRSFEIAEGGLAPDIRALQRKAVRELTATALDMSRHGAFELAVDLLRTGYGEDGVESEMLDSAAAGVLDASLRAGQRADVRELIDVATRAGRGGDWLVLRGAELAVVERRFGDAAARAAGVAAPELAGRAERLLAEHAFRQGRIADALDRAQRVPTSAWESSPLGVEFVAELFAAAAERALNAGKVQDLEERIAALEGRLPTAARGVVAAARRAVEEARELANARDTWRERVREGEHRLETGDAEASHAAFETALRDAAALGFSERERASVGAGLVRAILLRIDGGAADASLVPRLEGALAALAGAQSKPRDAVALAERASRVPDALGLDPASSRTLLGVAALLAGDAARNPVIRERYDNALAAEMAHLAALPGERIAVLENEVPEPLRSRPRVRALLVEAHLDAGWADLPGSPETSLRHFRAIQPTDGRLASLSARIGGLVAKRCAEPGRTAAGAAASAAVASALLAVARWQRQRALFQRARAEIERLERQGAPESVLLARLGEARASGDRSEDLLLQEARLRLRSGAPIPDQLNEEIRRLGPAHDRWLRARLSARAGRGHESFGLLAQMGDDPLPMRLEVMDAIRAAGGHPGLDLLHARGLVAAGRCREAAARLDVALEQEPSLEVADLYAAMASRLGDGAALARAGRVLVAARPEDSRLLEALLARLRTLSGEEETEGFLGDERLAEGPAVAAARGRLVEQRELQRRLAELSAIERRVDQGEGALLPELVDALRLAGRCDDALRRVQAALRERQPSSAELRLIGFLHLESGRPASAIPILRQYLGAVARGGGPPDLTALYALGNSLEQDGQLEDALDVYRRVHAFDLDYADAGERIDALEETLKGTATKAVVGTDPCRFCAVVNPPGARFCGGCGLTLEGHG